MRGGVKGLFRKSIRFGTQTRPSELGPGLYLKNSFKFHSRWFGGGLLVGGYFGFRVGGVSERYNRLYVAYFFSQKEKIENFSLLQGTYMGRFSEVYRSKACVLSY